jgi:hypothetical protein
LCAPYVPEELPPWMHGGLGGWTNPNISARQGRRDTFLDDELDEQRGQGRNDGRIAGSY